MQVRDACAGDVAAAVAFEIEIATVAFGEEAVLDPGVHRRRIEKALGRPGEVMLVAGDPPRGWLWMSERTNFLTGTRYANLRSLAGPGVASVLLDEAERRARDAGLTEIVGRTHVSNQAMRVLYAASGFEPEHLTMRRVLR